MNPVEIYVKACTVIFQTNFENDSSWTEILMLIQQLHKSLTCCACGKLLLIPMSTTRCEHSYCKACISNNSANTKLSCKECQNVQQLKENVQHRILLQCYKKISQHLHLMITTHKKKLHSSSSVNKTYLNLISEASNYPEDYHYINFDSRLFTLPSKISLTDENTVFHNSYKSENHPQDEDSEDSAMEISEGNDEVTKKLTEKQNLEQTAKEIQKPVKKAKKKNREEDLMQFLKLIDNKEKDWNILDQKLVEYRLEKPSYRVVLEMVYYALNHGTKNHWDWIWNKVVSMNTRKKVLKADFYNMAKYSINNKDIGALEWVLENSKPLLDDEEKLCMYKQGCLSAAAWNNTAALSLLIELIDAKSHKELYSVIKSSFKEAIYWYKEPYQGKPWVNTVALEFLWGKLSVLKREDVYRGLNDKAKQKFTSLKDKVFQEFIKKKKTQVDNGSGVKVIPKTDVNVGKVVKKNSRLSYKK